MIEPFNSPANSTKSSSSRLWFGLWLVLVSGVMAVVMYMRWRAVEKDHAAANVATVAGLLLVWLISIVVSLFAGRRGLWLHVVGWPLLSTGLFFACFRMERVDGELRPHFALRWAANKSLPAQSSENTGVSYESLFQAGPRDWPQFLGPGRDAVVASTAIETNWGEAAPKILWQQSIGEGWSGFAVVGDVGITQEQRGEEEWISAYDLNNGSMLWHYAIAARHYDKLGGLGPRSTPSVAGETVIACSAVSQVVALDLKTGRQLWTADLNQLSGITPEQLLDNISYGRSGSPLVFDQSVVVPLGYFNEVGAALICLDLKNGAEKWRSGNCQISYSSPAIYELSGATQIVYSAKDRVFGCDPQTGKQWWTVEYEGITGQPNVSQPIQLDEQTLFLSKGYGIGARLIEIARQAVPESGNASDGKWNATVKLEKSSVMRTKFTNPVLWQGFIYGLSDGILECIDARTLQRKWKNGRYHHGQCLMLKNCLLVSTEDGRVVLVDQDVQQHRELAELDVIGDVTWNPPTLSGDRLLIRNADEVACLQLVTTPADSTPLTDNDAQPDLRRDAE